MPRVRFNSTRCGMTPRGRKDWWITHYMRPPMDVPAKRRAAIRDAERVKNNTAVILCRFGRLKKSSRCETAAANHAYFIRSGWRTVAINHFQCTRWRFCCGLYNTLRPSPCCVADSKARSYWSYLRRPLFDQRWQRRRTHRRRHPARRRHVRQSNAYMMIWKVTFGSDR
jgi:hypothetical protein